MASLRLAPTSAAEREGCPPVERSRLREALSEGTWLWLTACRARRLGEV
jgi:hypothetical protein